MVLAILFCFNLPRFRFEASSVALLLSAAFVYAAPCFLTCSQPRYDFPVVPLFAVFAFVFPDALFSRTRRALIAPRHRLAMFLTLAFFFHIQIEWIAIVATA